MFQFVKRKLAERRATQAQREQIEAALTDHFLFERIQIMRDIEDMESMGIKPPMLTTSDVNA